jgi:lysozyme
MSVLLRPSPAAIALIKRHEGLRLSAYQDPGGVWTIGWGHTGDVTPGHVITEHQAEALLLLDAQTAAAAVNRRVRIPLEQHQFDALVSFVFNLGEGRFAESTLLKRVNQGCHGAAAAEFLRWTKGRHHGRKITLGGLVKRRDDERRLYLNREEIR